MTDEPADRGLADVQRALRGMLAHDGAEPQEGDGAELVAALTRRIALEAEEHEMLAHAAEVAGEHSEAYRCRLVAQRLRAALEEDL